uniref:MMS19 nucleotide excision repair protein n=1 Tax=Parascaris equorum TaxID=6256 RepID=A0A914S0D5_PAREQ
MYCKSDMNMGINEMDLDLLRHCIMNGHSVIRLEAFIALSQLLDRNYDRLGSDVPLLECIKQFVSDNLNTDDCCLRKEIFSRFRREWLANGQDEEKIGRIVDFCHLLVKYLPPETILRNILEGRNRYTAGVLKCVYELLNLDRELCVQYSHLVNLCVECNEEMMCASGSTAPGMCASLVELSAKLTPHCANELHITPGQCQTLNAYYYALWVPFLCGFSRHPMEIVDVAELSEGYVGLFWITQLGCLNSASSELLTLLCKCGRLSRELAERAYDSVWNVLIYARFIQQSLLCYSGCFVMANGSCAVLLHTALVPP